MLVMHLAGTPAPLRDWVPNVPAHVEAAIMRGLSRARDDRFDSIASFMGALRGEARGTAPAVERPSSSGDIPVVGESPAPGSGRTVAAQAVTTLSRATGEVDADAAEDTPLTATRTRRWPIFAVGGAAAAGLALFLLLRPGLDSTPQATTSTARVVVPDAGAAGPNLFARQTLPPDAGSAVALPGGRESEAAPPAAAGAPPARKRVHAAAREPGFPPASKKKRPDEEWFVH
jgi:hypothetical protein